MGYILSAAPPFGGGSGFAKNEPPASLLPKEYVQLKYIESTGTQYIDTGYIPDSNTHLTAKILPAYISGSRNFVLGAHAGLSDKAYALYVGSTGILYTTYGRGILESLQALPEAPFTVDKDKNVTTIGNSTAMGTVSTFASPVTLILFGVNDNGAAIPGKCRIYSCNIYDGDTFVRGFVPAMRRSDGKNGMYDIVHGEFYTDAAGGNFTGV